MESRAEGDGVVCILVGDAIPERCPTRLIVGIDMSRGSCPLNSYKTQRLEIQIACKWAWVIVWTSYKYLPELGHVAAVLWDPEQQLTKSPINDN